MTAIVLSALALIAAILLARYVRFSALDATLARAEPGLHRYGPVVAAIVSIGVVWFVWGALEPVPKVHDENSYLLQAEIFARGRWTATSPPIPDFFEQPHVQVVPAVASKYPPGHALLLSLGALIHFPAFIPLLLTGITAGLLFMLAARLMNVWIALLTWLLWLSAPIVLRYQPSYFSELTTCVMVLGGWWALLNWRETRRRRWMLLLALAVGWGAITRPLTMLAFAIPIAIVVVRDVWRYQLWYDLIGGLAVGVALLLVLPLWSARTTGNWRISPLEQYRKDYLPFDKMGFTPDTSAPRRTVSLVLKSTYYYFLTARKEQRLATLPQTAAHRVLNLVIAFFQGSRLPLLLFAIAGLLFMNAPQRFAVASALLVFLAHLPYAHWAPWTVYYLETAPVVAAVTALGIWRTLERITLDEARVKLGVVLISAALVVFAIPSIDLWRRDHGGRSAFDSRFAVELKKLPPHSIVFVQYSPRFAQHINVVFNYADLNAAPVWVVHNLGVRNAELRAKAPDRLSFDFDEDQLVRGLRR